MGLFSLHRDFLQSHMILGLVGTLSPALDSKFQEARRSLIQKLRELTQRPPMVRREGRNFPRLGANGASVILRDNCWCISPMERAWGQMPFIVWIFHRSRKAVHTVVMLRTEMPGTRTFGTHLATFPPFAEY